MDETDFERNTRPPEFWEAVWRRQAEVRNEHMQLRKHARRRWWLNLTHHLVYAAISVIAAVEIGMLIIGAGLDFYMWQIYLLISIALAIYTVISTTTGKP